MATTPRFINPQNTSVGVISPDKRKLYVQPFANQKFSTEKTDVFVVEGEHYRQFVAPGGPLACFPEAAAVPAAMAQPPVPAGPVGGARGAGAAGDSAPAGGGAPAAPAADAGAAAAADAAAVSGDAGSDADTTLHADPALVAATGTVTPKADEPKVTTPAKVAPRPVPRPGQRR